MFNEAFGNHVAKLRNQTFFHEHLVEFPFLRIYKEASHSLIEIVKYLFEVDLRFVACLYESLLFLYHLVKYPEEAINVAV